MGKFFKRTSFALLATMFSFLPILNVGATENEPRIVDCREIGRLDLCKDYAPAPVDENLLGETNERYIDITMHAGKHGQFESGESARTVTYFRGDTFDEETVPIPNDTNYVFAGWSTSPSATEVDVVSGMTASAVGSDIYAVYTDKCYVYYYIYNGIWESPSGDSYQAILMEYDTGTHFRELAPDPISLEKSYDFDGWYTSFYGAGEHYTSETVVDEPIVELYSKWVHNPNRTEAMELNQEYDITVGVSTPLFKFTPTETAYYEIYTDGIEDDGSDREAVIALTDADDHSLAREVGIVPHEVCGNVHLYYEMEAGQTYYVRFAEMEGSFMRYTATIRKVDTVTVRFYANKADSAWFDDNHSVTVKEIELPIGDEISSFMDSGLDYDRSWLSFVGWAPEEDASSWHNTLLVEGPTDVYAFWQEFENFTLDAGEGIFPFTDAQHTYLYKYLPGDAFETPIDPKIDDAHRKFIGWSRTSGATEPDADILEGVTPASDFRNQTLYAVYDEKVLETFVVTDGGYMMDNPAITTYQVSKGNGHIFYGMAVSHDNPKMKPIGWTDQNGVFIDATSEAYPYYHVNGDTTYTVVWGYETIVFAVEGRFSKTGSQVARIRLPYENGDGTFSSAALEELVGKPIAAEPSLYFLGWASDIDATEPDIIDGVTRLEDIDSIYGVWAEDEYYFDKNENATWTHGSSEDLEIVVKRRMDDQNTFRYYVNASVDGEILTKDQASAEEGSLILTLKSDYLESLSDGEHDLAIYFAGESAYGDFYMNTTITIDEAEEESEEGIVVPSTPDAPNTGEYYPETSEKNTKADIIIITITIILMLGIIVKKCDIMS